jgi:hypothetical protein
MACEGTLLLFKKQLAMAVRTFKFIAMATGTTQVVIVQKHGQYMPSTFAALEFPQIVIELRLHLLLSLLCLTINEIDLESETQIVMQFSLIRACLVLFQRACDLEQLLGCVQAVGLAVSHERVP